MSDARWFEIQEDVRAACQHFARSAELFAAGGFAGDDLSSYRAAMALMHAMQSGHTSMETALVRILSLAGEDAPTGSDWHADLIRRVASTIGDRPPILPPGLVAAAQETRRFRHVAMCNYGHFEPVRAEPAIQAASTLAAQLTLAIETFRTRIDP